MSYKNISKKQKQEERICDICGEPNALLRTFTSPEHEIINWISGFTCQKCLDADKEPDYVKNMWDTKIGEDEEYDTLVDELEKLDPDSVDAKKVTKRLDDLDKNQELRDQLAERFQRIRLDDKTHFVCSNGLGVEHEKCEICGQGFSYLCIVEDHFDDGHVYMLDEIGGWFCASCIVTGRQRTHTSRALRELMLLRKECADVEEKYEFSKSMGALQSKEKKEYFLSTFEHGKELEAQEAKYKSTAELMMAARLAYQGTPVKVVIKTGGEGDTCSFCGKTFGKDHKCGDMQNTEGDMNAF